MDGQPRRLDSWKEIADYLGRDVRTAMRWAKSQQLPIRRIGGQGRSVFAFTNEIDAWLAGHPAAAPVHPPAPAPAPEPAEVIPAAPPRSMRWYRAGAIALATLAVLIIGMTARWSARSGASDPLVRIEANELAIVLTDEGGGRREILRFDPDVPPVMTIAPPRFHDADADGTRDVLAGVSYYVDHGQRMPRSGELINLSRDGSVRWRFTFNDVLTFRDERFDGPWGLTDWSVGPASSPARIAVAAHHHMWWASMAAVLDHHGRRLRTFVHPGWIESLMWLDGRRLALAGFSNARDAAMLAVVDVEQPDARAPGTENTAFDCTSCAAGTPLFYAAFGRSELNVVNGGRFNRAAVSRQNGRIVVRTVEVEANPVAATAIYEFDTELRLVRAQYEDTYWTLHGRLEREGKIAHTREACADRDGPPAIHVWTSTGWQRVAAPR